VRHAAAQKLLDRLDASSPVLAGEIDYAAANAQAVRLSDAVLRRTPLGSAGYPGASALERAAAMLAPRHGWDEPRVREEIGLVEAAYPPK
jgi:glycerol-3-phosphate dehydrogenase